MYLPNLTDTELALHARAEFNALVSTALEVELLKRFEALIDPTETPFADVLDEFDYEDAAELRADLNLAIAIREATGDVLDEFDYEDAAELRADLNLAIAIREATGANPYPPVPKE